ncbi:MAG: replicative DNA helicase, partial [Muribaculaceae bacterium]|nr:replicative DNA helicase [Muribaculaceae bacterium]
MAVTNPTSKYGDRKGRDKQQSEYITQGRMQPRDIDLEQAVLGALMLEKDAYAVVCDMLKPETFYEPAHSLIFEAIRALGTAQQPIDMLTVTEQVRQDGNLDKIGGPIYIS